MHRQSKLLCEAARQYTDMMAAKRTTAPAPAPHWDGGFEEFDAYMQALGMPPLGALGNPGSDMLCQGWIGADQGVDGFQNLPDMSMGGF